MFVLGLGLDVSHGAHSLPFAWWSKPYCRVPWGHDVPLNPISTSLCHVITVYGLIQPIAGRNMVKKYFRSLDRKTMEWWFVGIWAPFWAMVPVGLPLNHQKSSPRYSFNPLWGHPWAVPLKLSTLIDRMSFCTALEVPMNTRNDFNRCHLNSFTDSVYQFLN